MQVLTDALFAEQIPAITRELKKCRKTGQWKAFDGLMLYYEYFLCPNAKGNVVMVHGLSEFTAKYYEMAHYFLQEGYNVFMYDQRCHGFSGRLTPNPDVIHVARFDHYVTDMADFIEQIVLPNSQGLPLYGYAHSMGGAVTLLYLCRHTNGPMVKAALSAPLIGPVVKEVPYWVARLSMYLRMLLQGKTAIFNPKQIFDPEKALRNSTAPGKNRFLHNLVLRQEEPLYQSTPLTVGWIYQSLCLPSLLKKQGIYRLPVPMLLLSGTEDTVVRTELHEVFARRNPHCRIHHFPGADHSMLTGDDKTVTEYVTAILDFFRT